MDKKTIAYIMIGVGVAAAAYYFFRKAQDSATAAGLGAGSPDTRGAWAADDDALYTKMRNRVKAHKDKYDGEQALGWIDDAVANKYAAGPGQYNIKGQASKAGAFLEVFAQVNPNESGKFKSSTNQNLLFPESLVTTLWNDFNAFKVKYGGL